MPIIDTADIARSRNKYKKLNLIANNGEEVFRVNGLKRKTGPDIMSVEEDEENLARYRQDRRVSINVDGIITDAAGGGMNRRGAAIDISTCLAKPESKKHLHKVYKDNKAIRNKNKNKIQTENRASLYPVIVSKVMYGHTRRENYGAAVWNQWPFNGVAMYDPEFEEKALYFNDATLTSNDC